MRLRLSLLVAVSCLVAASHALADPIEITRGTVALMSPISGLDPPFGFQLFGDGTAITMETFAVASGFARAGEPVDLSMTVTPSQSIGHPLPELLNGAPFDVFLTGALRFSATPFIAPATISGSFSTPFTLSGMLSGFSSRDHAGAPLFTANLTGQGTASLLVVRDVGGDFLATGTAFTFSAPPVDATPEPGTLVLLVSGLAFGALSRRRRATART